MLPAMTALRVERDGDVLRVTMTRPEARNAFDEALIAALAEAFVDVGKARAVVLAGEGPSFCAGADVEWMRSSADVDYDTNVADANALRRMLQPIHSCPPPPPALPPGVLSPFVRGKSGAGAARWLFVTGEPFDASTALRIGLVH